MSNTVDTHHKDNSLNDLRFYLSDIQDIGTIAHTTDASLGPMTDNGAPSSAIGFHELVRIALDVRPGRISCFDDIPPQFAACPYWQCGCKGHERERRVSFGFIYIDANIRPGYGISICHLFSDGSSQWVIGNYVTFNANINNTDVCEMVLAYPDGVNLSVPLLSNAPNLHIDRSLFTKLALPACFSDLIKTSSWYDVRCTTDIVQKHVFGRATLGDIATLLRRNNLQTESSKKYFDNTVTRCTFCRFTGKPKPSHKASISKMNREFSDLVCIDHRFLDGQCVVHITGAHTRYSARLVIHSASLDEAVFTFKTCRLIPL